MKKKIRDNDFRKIWGTAAKNIRQTVSYWQEICEIEPEKAKFYSNQINDAISKNDFFKFHLLTVESMGLKVKVEDRRPDKNIDDIFLLSNNLRRLECLIKGQKSIDDKCKGGKTKLKAVLKITEMRLLKDNELTAKEIWETFGDSTNSENIKLDGINYQVFRDGDDLCQEELKEGFPDSINREKLRSIKYDRFKKYVTEVKNPKNRR